MLDGAREPRGSVNALPTISAVAPPSGARGASHLHVTVSGTGYQPSAGVTIR
jgi:hypothetical protein